MSDDFPDDLAPRQGGPGARLDPQAAARQAQCGALPRRFYERATIEPRDEGFVLTLDARPARTPGRNPLAAPTRALGEAIAAEWAAQGETIDPGSMPLTRIANSALDGVAREREAVLAEIAKYAGSDLVCYRAAEPERLVAAQNEAWEPVLAFARERLDARFALAEGVMFVAQPPEAIAAVEARLARETCPFRVAALHVMTTLTGSALIALAAADGALDGETAWRAAHVDEITQESFWGADEQALARRAARKREFNAALAVYALAGEN
ncbi:MAG: ATPase [Salinarimonadaceae bacterium]|nr:MAG: ATPase [Salinarimonadaceae bacterium]